MINLLKCQNSLCQSLNWRAKSQWEKVMVGKATLLWHHSCIQIYATFALTTSESLWTPVWLLIIKMMWNIGIRDDDSWLKHSISEIVGLFGISHTGNTRWKAFLPIVAHAMAAYASQRFLMKFCCNGLTILAENRSVVWFDK